MINLYENYADKYTAAALDVDSLNNTNPKPFVSNTYFDNDAPPEYTLLASSCESLKNLLCEWNLDSLYQTCITCIYILVIILKQ